MKWIVIIALLGMIAIVSLDMAVRYHLQQRAKGFSALERASDVGIEFVLSEKHDGIELITFDSRFSKDQVVYWLDELSGFRVDLVVLPESLTSVVEVAHHKWDIGRIEFVDR